MVHVIEWKSCISLQCDRRTLILINFLTLRVPPSSLTVRDVKSLVGSRRQVDVMELHSQDTHTMTMSQWTKYFELQPRQQVLNVISLEFSHTELDPLVQPPTLVGTGQTCYVQCWYNATTLHIDYCELHIDGLLFSQCSSIHKTGSHNHTFSLGERPTSVTSLHTCVYACLLGPTTNYCKSLPALTLHILRHLLIQKGLKDTQQSTINNLPLRWQQQLLVDLPIQCLERWR